jgi:hypothetical protein
MQKCLLLGCADGQNGRLRLRASGCIGQSRRYGQKYAIEIHLRLQRQRKLLIVASVKERKKYQWENPDPHHL